MLSRRRFQSHVSFPRVIAGLQARRQRGAMPTRFSFLPPPIYFLPLYGIFLGGRSCFFWPEKTLNFVISVRKSLRILAKTFFLEITCFWPEKSDKILARKSLQKSAKTFAPPILILPPPPPPPILRSWRRPCWFEKQQLLLTTSR